MKILKIIGLTIVGIIALALITALFLKKDIVAKREVIINKPKQEVFDYLKYLKNQDHFSVWAKADTAMKKEYTGTDATVGFKSAWDSEKVGKGEQTIIGIQTGEYIDYSLHFIEPFEATNHARFTTVAVDSSHTKVVWEFDGRMTYPFNLLQLFHDIGDDLQKGLDDLKVILEK